ARHARAHGGRTLVPRAAERLALHDDTERRGPAAAARRLRSAGGEAPLRRRHVDRPLPPRAQGLPARRAWPGPERVQRRAPRLGAGAERSPHPAPRVGRSLSRAPISDFSLGFGLDERSLRALRARARDAFASDAAASAARRPSG